MNKFDQDTKLADVPPEAMVISMPGACVMAAGGEENKNIRLKLYDGSIIDHFCWGNLAFELKSMKLAKDRVAILADHDTDRRVGFSTGATFDGEFVMEGKQLDNEHARAIREDSLAGFPFEASLRFDPNLSKIEHIMDGATVEVNGHTLKGPGTLIRDTTVVEGSVVTLGKANNCRTEVFNHSENKDKEIDMVDKIALTVDSLAKDYPDIHKAIVDGAFAKGVEEVKKQFAAFSEQFGDDPALLVEQFGKGATIGEAMAAENVALKKKNEQLTAKLGKSEQGGNETGGSGKKGKVDPAEQEFSDNQEKANKGEEEAGDGNLSKDEEMRKQFTESDQRGALVGDCGGDEEKAFSVFRSMEKAKKDGRIKI